MAVIKRYIIFKIFWRILLCCIQHNPEILFLKQEDVVKAGLLDMKQIMEVTEKTYAMLGKGFIKNPPKTNTSIPDKANWQSFFNSHAVLYRRRCKYCRR